MTMRLEVSFPRPLAAAEQIRFLIAVSALAGAKRIRFLRGGYAAVVSGEGMSTPQLRRAVTEEGLSIESLRSSLSGDEDPAPAAPPVERYRPIGR
jgi:hypothetical protein